MAEFKEELVINVLHTDKAVIGKKYWFADHILTLKTVVEKGFTDKNLYELTGINATSHLCFESDDGKWELLYPYEEPPKQRMTNIQLMEWCAKGNGEFTWENDTQSYTEYPYAIKLANEYVDDTIIIRTWDSEEWVKPTVDIYEKDCKGGKD